MSTAALDDLSADEVIEQLGLEYLEGEGVWIKVLWRTEHANAIYCLLTPDGFSALHRLREDEAWVHVAGSSVEQVILGPGGETRIVRVGTGVGEDPQSRVEAGCWQGARPTGEWSLVVCMLAPAFTGFELADEATDLSAWPDAQALARELVRG